MLLINLHFKNFLVLNTYKLFKKYFLSKQSIHCNHLIFNLFRGVGEEYGCVWIAGGHLCLGALKSRQEGGVEQSWLLESELGRDISCHAEIRVLKTS